MKEFDSNILVVSGFWPTSANPITGIFVVQQIAAFVRLGCKVTIVVTNTIGYKTALHLSIKQLGLPADRVRLVASPVVRLPEKLSGIGGGFRLNVKTARRMYQRSIARLARNYGPFDACIVHGIRYMGLSIPTWRHHISGGMVMVAHGIDPFLAKPLNADKIKPFIVESLNAVDTFVVVGKLLVPHFLKLGASAQEIYLVPNGTDLPSNMEVNDRQNDNNDFRKIISVSNLIEWKGIGLNIRALADLSKRRPDLEWNYQVIGDGPERGHLTKLAEKLGIAKNISFLGRLEYEQTMRKVAEADIFSLPSWSEAFGIVYLEAMARMRPVIGCQVNGASEIITHGKSGLLIPPHNIPALAAALEQLIEDVDLCRELGREGRRTAERFSWENNARQILLFAGVISSGLP